MKPIKLLFALAIGAASFSAMHLTQALAQQPADWDKVVEAAKKEGEIIVWAQASDSSRKFWKDAFEKDNPGIKVNLFQPSNTAERDTRVLREWEAKVLKVDVFVAGSAGMVARLKPAGILQPVKPFLRDDTLDGKNWIGGAPVWVDLEKQYVMIADLPAGVPAIANESVDINAIKNWTDLLDPKWDGKIISLDPRQSGQTYAFTLFLNASKDLGPDFVRKFFKGGRVVFTNDQRQIGEWVDSGRMMLGFALREPEIRSLLSVGSKIKTLPALMAGGVPQTITVGSDSSLSVVNLNPLPHPNAVRVYANWIYSKAGQQAMVDATGLFSTRVDVDTSKLPDRVKQKVGVKYTNANDENLNGTELTKAMRDNVTAAIVEK
jgi:iron(III) transport system substrate-binding protein